jgi:uncharacterized protein (TIGR03000 family)
MYTAILALALGNSVGQPCACACACQCQCNVCNACNGCNYCNCQGCFARWRHHHRCHGCFCACACNYGCNCAPCCAPACCAPACGAPAGEALPTPKGKTVAANGTSAQIVVDVPTDARLFIDDQPTTSVGARRTFVTPELGTEVSYDYTVRVELSRDGRTYRDSRTVQIKGGQITGISFAELGQNATVRTGYSD